MYRGMVNTAFKTFMKKLGMPEYNFMYGKQKTTPVLLLLINVLGIIYLS